MYSLTQLLHLPPDPELEIRPLNPTGGLMGSPDLLGAVATGLTDFPKRPWLRLWWSWYTKDGKRQNWQT